MASGLTRRAWAAFTTPIVGPEDPSRRTLSACGGRRSQRPVAPCGAFSSQHVVERQLGPSVRAGQNTDPNGDRLHPREVPEETVEPVVVDDRAAGKHEPVVVPTGPTRPTRRRRPPGPGRWWRSRRCIRRPPDGRRQLARRGSRRWCRAQAETRARRPGPCGACRTVQASIQGAVGPSGAVTVPGSVRAAEPGRRGNPPRDRVRAELQIMLGLVLGAMPSCHWKSWVPTVRR